MEKKTPPGGARAAKTGKAPRRPAGRATTLSSGLALILSVLAFLSFAYLWYSLTQKQELHTSEALARLEKLEGDTGALRESLGALQNDTGALRETQDTLKAGLEKLQGELGRGRSEWLLAETEQLLVIANNRLQLAREVGQALAALRTADRQLKQLANPGLLPVRRILAEEIAALEALEQIDISGMALRLGSLAARVERLPLATTARLAEGAAAPAEPAPGGVRTLARELWRDLTELVRIRSTVELHKPLLAPEQRYFLHENLRLMLYGAQVALLHTDGATFEQNVKTAHQWLKDYYDGAQPAVQAAQNDLNLMLKARLRTVPPDISRSLETLRRLTAKKAGP